MLDKVNLLAFMAKPINNAVLRYLCCRYKEDVSSEQKEALMELCRVHVHSQVVYVLSVLRFLWATRSVFLLFSLKIKCHCLFFIVDYSRGSPRVNTL